MTWLKTAQQSEELSALAGDIESYLEEGLSFYAGMFYYRVVDVGGGWVAFKNDQEGAETDRSKPYKRRSDAAKWIANDIPAMVIDESFASPESRQQWNASRRVTVGGMDYAPVHVVARGASRYMVARHLSTEETMGGHRPSTPTLMSANVYRQDASIIDRFAFSRFSDLTRFMTSKWFRDNIGMRHGGSGPWEGDNANIGSLIHVLRELGDIFKMGGTVFTGRTLSMGRDDAPDFDKEPYVALLPRVSPDDIFMSFVNALWPDDQKLRQLTSAIREIANRRYPDRRVDVLDTDLGPVVAVRRSDSFSMSNIGSNAEPAFRHEEPTVTDDELEAVIGDDETIAGGRTGIPKKAQANGTKEFVTAMLRAEEQSIFYLDEIACSLDITTAVDSDQWIGVYRVIRNGRSMRSGAYPTTEEAIEWLATSAASYAASAGYENPEAMTIGDLDVERQVRETGYVRSGGYRYFARRVPSERGSVPHYVIERVPHSNFALAEASMVDADVYRNAKFTREKDAKTFLVFGQYERLWDEDGASRRVHLGTAIIGRLRTVSLPAGAKLVSGQGWREMGNDEHLQFTSNRTNLMALDVIRGRDAAGILLAESPRDLDALVDTIRERTGLNATAPTPTLILVTVPEGSPAAQATPTAAPEETRPPARDFFEGIEPPDDDDDDFPIVISSTRTAARRKRRVVSFDYDSTTVLPDIDPATGSCEYDDDGEPVSTLNPVAADLMRRHHAMGDKVVIVTARTPDSLESVWRMIRENSLPVSEVYATSHQSKVPTLRSIGAAVHYDDSPHHVHDINQMLGPRTRAYFDSDMEEHLMDGGTSDGGEHP